MPLFWAAGLAGTSDIVAGPSGASTTCPGQHSGRMEAGSHRSTRPPSPRRTYDHDDHQQERQTEETDADESVAHDG